MTKTIEDVITFVNPPPPKKAGRPPGKMDRLSQREQKKTGQFEVGHTKGGRPPGVKNKIKMIAEALISDKCEPVTKMLLKIALEEGHKDQMTAIKLVMERILPPVREVNVRQDTQTSINVIVEGVQAFVKEAIDAEVVECIEDMEDV
jgi:hypothetical protein